MSQTSSLGPHLTRTWEELPDQADILIVGGGLAGLELAAHLERAGADDVLVVEAGADGDLQHVYAANDAASADRIWTDEQSDEYFVQPWSSATEPHFGQGSGLRRRVGGRSLYWHGVLLPVEDWALTEADWPRAVIDDLAHSWQGGASLYDRVRSDLMEWSRQAATGGAAPDDNALRVGPFRFVDPPRAVRPAAPEPSAGRRTPRSRTGWSPVPPPTAPVAAVASVSRRPSKRSPCSPPRAGRTALSSGTE